MKLSDLKPEERQRAMMLAAMAMVDVRTAVKYLRGEHVYRTAPRERLQNALQIQPK